MFFPPQETSLKGALTIQLPRLLGRASSRGSLGGSFTPILKATGTQDAESALTWSSRDLTRENGVLDSPYPTPTPPAKLHPTCLNPHTPFLQNEMGI